MKPQRCPPGAPCDTRAADAAELLAERQAAALLVAAAADEAARTVRRCREEERRAARFGWVGFAVALALSAFAAWALLR